MRSSERKDIFSEKFSNLGPRDAQQQSWNNSNTGLSTARTVLQHRSTNSGESYSSFEEGLLMRNRDKEKGSVRERDNIRARERADTESSTTAVSTQQQGQDSPSDSSFSLGGSAVWVGDESGLELAKDNGGDASSVLSLVGSNTLVGSNRKRRSTDASSSSSQAHSRDQTLRPVAGMTQYHDSGVRPGITKDTHFYHMTVAYKDHPLPIKMPLSTFPEEVGDVRGAHPYSRPRKLIRPA